MNIENLEEFITLAEKLNFSQTANEHYITQPVLTKHIKQLEEDMGAPLFYRDHQNVSLTQMGELFLPDAVMIVNTYKNAKAKIRTALNGYSSSLTIAFLDAAIREQLPQWIQSFHALYPDVNVDCINTNILGASDLLRNRACDMAVTLQMPMLSYPDFESHLLYRDPVCLFVPLNHRFADQSSVSLNDLSGETFIMASSDFVKDYQIFIEHVFERAKIRITSGRMVESVEQAFMLVNAGIGVTLAPMHQKLFSTSNIRTVPLEEPDVYINVVLTWLKTNANSNVGKFLKIVEESEIK